MAYRDLFSDKIKNILSPDDWLVVETDYDSRRNLEFETLFCLASGAMGNRGSHEEGFVRKTLPANYLHGVFDRSEALQRELCNTPDWCKLKMYYRCDPIGMETGKEINEYVRVLDLRNGILAKHYVLESFDGRKTRVEILKFLSRNSPRCGAFRVYLVPLNYCGILELENIIDATVTNFSDYPRFRVKHLTTREVSKVDGFGVYVQSETRDFKLQIGTMAAVKIMDLQGNDRCRSRHFRPYGEVACEFLDTIMEENQAVVIDKFAAVVSGRDFGDVKEGAQKELHKIYENGFDRELQLHIAQYDMMWNKADLVIKGDDKMQKAVRFNLFHLMSTPNPTDNRSNIGAKLIHGEEYGGHAFWDTELFILPFFDYVFPDIARNLVEYRYLLLDKARENARNNGYEGAKFPWESADTGDEECPDWTIEPDGSCERCHVADYEHHVTAAVAYGCKKYAEITGDNEFFDSMGMELFLETARFWVSRLQYNMEEDRYEILKVTGPDEWHEPVDNNAYTNHLAKWNLTAAMDLLQEYQENKPAVYAKLIRKTGLSDSEVQNWKRIAEKIYVKNTEGLIEQFDGYFNLFNEVISEWDCNGMPLWPKEFGDNPREKCCILKQADVVMLMFLLDKEFTMETQRINFNYYEQRTLHRSSLSPSIHAMMGLRVGDDQRAYQYLERSATVDLANNQGNTREGIHAASAGGTWQCITLGFCGMSQNRDGDLAFTPKLPDHWLEIRYQIIWRGVPVEILVRPDDVNLTSESEIPYWVNGKKKMSALKGRGETGRC